MTALTPQTIRLDLKCGKGSISKGEKCTKGPATAATRSGKKTKDPGLLNKALVLGGTAAVIGGIGYGAYKYNRGMQISKESPGPRATPEEQIAQGRRAFKEVRALPLAAKVVGAGITAAGVGIAKYGVENQNAAAIVGGGYLTALGATTFIQSGAMKTQLQAGETEFELKGEQYKQQYYAAREAAKRRQKEAGNYYTNSRTSANKAVPNPFKDLGVKETASDAEIKSAWLRLMRQNHPDAGGDPRKATQINAAYQEILRRRGRKDSIWADGFSIDWDLIAV